MLGTVAVGALLAGCAVSPPVQPNGLPRVSRYTNSAQLDFMLSRYRTVAEQAASGTAPASDDLLDQACLGWERALFDLQSARRYPALLRLSTESANLAQIWHELPLLAQRSPRPEACGPVGAPSSPGSPGHAEPGQPTAPPEQTGQTAPAAQTGQTAPAQQGGPGQAAQAAAPAALAAASAEAAGQPGAGSGPGAASASSSTGQAIAPDPAATTSAPARSESKAATERRYLDQLRTALGLAIAPPKHFAETFADPTVPLPVTGRVDLATLRTLADSELPIIRLRARFHLLGLCTLAVEAADRFGQPPSSATGSADAGRVGPTDPSVCGKLQPGDTLRHAQRRLLASLLSAWRVKYPEPMTDLVVALANFASRDNPVVDGPRVAR